MDENRERCLAALLAQGLFRVWSLAERSCPKPEYEAANSSGSKNSLGVNSTPCQPHGETHE